MVNEAQLRALVEDAPGPVVVLDADGNVLAASATARDADPGETLTLYAGEPPTAYQELRSGFTAAVSHELRTPLARTITAAELALRRERTPEEYREAIGSVLSNTHQLTRIDGMVIRDLQREAQRRRQAWLHPARLAGEQTTYG